MYGRSGTRGRINVARLVRVRQKARSNRARRDQARPQSEEGERELRRAQQVRDLIPSIESLLAEAVKRAAVNNYELLSYVDGGITPGDDELDDGPRERRHITSRALCRLWDHLEGNGLIPVIEQIVQGGRSTEPKFRILVQIPEQSMAAVS